MSINRRVDDRLKVTIPAKLLAKDEKLIQFVIVRNVSAKGCMIVGRNLEAVPDDFYLVIAGDPTPVSCAAVWRTKHSLGVKLSDDATLSQDLQRLFMSKAGTCDDDQEANYEGIAEHHARTMRSIATLHDDFAQAVAAGEPLPAAQVVNASVSLSETIRTGSLKSWLQAVRSHSSYTYRHCMTVSGLAVAFAQHLGFSEHDVQRMGIGALMHDIGKVKIPLEILDKPGKLTDEEYEEIRKHPVHGAEILRQDGQFSDEVIDLTLHHHELLDGSGYPDGLSGEQISDPVRLLTIADIFSALIDKRSYKDEMPAEKAFGVLQEMDGKLEIALVRSFKPIALAAPSSEPTVFSDRATA